LHWIFALVGAAMIAIAAAMALVAVLTSDAAAQENTTINQSISTPPAAENAAQRRPTSVLGAYAQRDRGSDMVLPNLEALPKKPPVDWVLLKAAGVLFLSGIALMLLGRGIRYVMSNE
jgi:hypothetical protein